MFLTEGGKKIFNVTSGNFLEMYDYSVFALYAQEIGAAFFPKTEPGVALLYSFFYFLGKWSYASSWWYCAWCLYR